jgi:cytochrome c oxidase assembly protein subunit 15
VFLNLNRIAIALAFFVVVLGAYTRLSDAGLGCPDWPGCYGRVVVPGAQEDIDPENELYASRPLESGKAWKEMVHRYAAGALGVLIVALAVLAWRNRLRPEQPVVIPLLLVGLVIFQALLGMWTVTLLLKPIIVMGHLLGGMTILALLYWIYLHGSQNQAVVRARKPLLGFWPVLGLIIIAVQISLGGWTGANYAALICPDLPRCQGLWWPPMNFIEGFTPWRGLGVNYEFGILDGPARTAVHMSHRLGAMITLVTVGWIALRAIRSAELRVRRAGQILLPVLIVQFSLGVANVLLTLPIAAAVTHNGVAALLLLSALALVFHTRYTTT